VEAAVKVKEQGYKKIVSYGNIFFEAQFVPSIAFVN
jgi:hypothetical protein